MKKPLLVMSCMVMVLLTQAASAQEIAKRNDKQIEELSTKFFRYSAIDGKQSLTLMPEPGEEWYAKAFNDDCDNTIVKLGTPGAALSIPGTSLILAFLECPASRGFEYDAIVAFFDRNNVSTSLCFSRLDLMAQTTKIRYYYYGGIQSLEAREARDKALYIVATLSGGDGGDYWTSFAFLHIDMNCRLTLLSKVYSSYHCNGDCDGDKMEYHFVDNKTVEVITRDITSDGHNAGKVGKTTREEYHLEELYSNPRLRTFPSKTEKAAALLNSGADINKRDKDGTTPLMWAVKEGSPSVVKALINKSAQVNAKDMDGDTPLFHAVKMGHTEVVKVLLDRGVEIEAKDKYNYTPLMRAAQEGRVAMVRLLLEKGAHVNATMENGSTSLMQAAENGHDSIVKLLLQRGAYVNGTTEGGWTSLMYAAKEEYPEIVKSAS